MDNHYIISNNKIVELLDVLDSFSDKMNDLIKEYPKYSYTMEVSKDDYNGWKAIIKVKTENDTNERDI